MTKQKGRKKLDAEEKTKRDEFLKNEKITDRTKRVLNPRINKLLKDYDRLINAIKSPRYYFNDEQKEKLLDTFIQKTKQLEQSLKISTKEEVKDIL